MIDCCAVIIDKFADGSRSFNNIIEQLTFFVNETVFLTSADAADLHGICGSVRIITISGEESFASLVKTGIARVHDRYSVVAVHDVAQPFKSYNNIKDVLVSAQYGGAIIGTKAIDTIKVVENSLVSRTIDRNYVWSISSPFAANTEIMERICDNIIHNNIICSNTASLISQFFKAGIDIKIIEGSVTKNDSDSWF